MDLTSGSWRSDSNSPPPGSGSSFGGGHRPWGAYQLLEELGRGAYGVVYRARDSRDGGEVALKVLLRGDPRTLERFRREVEAIRRLDHPHLVRHLDHGVHEGRPFLVTELVDGESLDAVLGAKGPLRPRRAATLIRDASLALQFAHERNVLHRDLKPANLMIDARGVRLVDFGLARVAAVSDSPTLTKSGAMLGTGPYLSPEQARGDRTRVGVRSEVYSLGATLYEALTGEAPFVAGSIHELFVQINTEPVEPPSALRKSIPPGLDEICLRCLEKKPEDRYESAAELATALTDFLDLSSARARAPVRGPSLRAVLTALLSVSLTLGVVIAVFLSSRNTPEREPAPTLPETPPVPPKTEPTAAPPVPDGVLDPDPPPPDVSALPTLAAGLSRWTAPLPFDDVVKAGPWALLLGSKPPRLFASNGGPPVAGPKDAGPAVAWDSTRQRLLLASSDGVIAWKPDPSSSEALVTGLESRPISLCVAGQTLLVGSRSGQLLAYDLLDLKKTRWRLTLEGPIRAAPLALDLSGDGALDHVVVGTLASRLSVVGLARGDSVGNFTLRSPLRYRPLQLPGLDPPQILLATQEGELHRFRVSTNGLRSLASLELQQTIATQPVLVQSAGTSQLLVGTYKGWLLSVSSKLDQVNWAINHDDNPLGGLAVVDLDRDGDPEICSAWLKTGAKLATRVEIHSPRGEKLLTLPRGSRPLFVTAAGSNSLVGAGVETVAWGPWTPLRPLPGGRVDAWTNLCGGAYQAAIQSARANDNPARELIEALAEWHLGSRERLAALDRAKPGGVQRTLRPLIGRWADHGDLTSARRLATPIGLRLSDPKMNPPQRLTTVSVPSEGGAFRFVDITRDPIQAAGTWLLSSQRGSFRRHSRVPLGLLLSVRGRFIARFKVEQERRVELRFLHRALPNHVQGYAAFQLLLDGLPLGAPREAPARPIADPFWERVDLGVLSAGNHELQWVVLPGSVTFYDLQRFELRED